MRKPSHWREELRPEEIVRRPSRHPWLSAFALAVAALVVGALLRALAAAAGGSPPAAGHIATPPDEPAAAIARSPGAKG